MLPSSRSQSAATTALTAGICELFRVKRLPEIPQTTVVDFGALGTPYLRLVHPHSWSWGPARVGLLVGRR